MSLRQQQARALAAFRRAAGVQSLAMYEINILRAAPASDGGGGTRVIWANLNTAPVAALFYPKERNRGEEIKAGKVQSASDHEFVIALTDAQLTVRDRIELVETGKIFDVVQVSERLHAVLIVKARLVE